MEYINVACNIDSGALAHVCCKMALVGNNLNFGQPLLGVPQSNLKMKHVVWSLVGIILEHFPHLMYGTCTGLWCYLRLPAVSCVAFDSR